MRAFNHWRMPPSSLLLLVAITTLGPSTALAQTTTELPAITTSTGTTVETDTSSTGTATASAASSTSTAAQSSVSDASTTSETSPASSAPNTDSTTGTSTTDLPGVPTSTTLPAVTISGLPTLSGGYSYPAPSVPPTANAPYMQTSNLPEGSVFIAVGSALAFFGLVILAWRVLVAWSINRSVQRAAAAGYRQVSEPKAYRNKSGPEPYSDAPIGTSMSMEKLGPGSRTATTVSKGPAPNASLFFSPTAGAGMRTPSSQQNSTYLPAGYYAAGSAAPGGGAGVTTIGGTADRPSRSHAPSGRLVIGGGKVRDPSPADSGIGRTAPSGVSTPDSRSVLNVPPPAGSRTPSTYLEDLMSSNAPPMPPSADRAFVSANGGHRSRRNSRGGGSRRNSRGPDSRRNSQGAEGSSRRHSRSGEEIRRSSRDGEARKGSRGGPDSSNNSSRRASRGPDSRRNSQGHQQDSRRERETRRPYRD